LGRYGGEEFLLILPDTAKDQAVRTVDRLRSIVLEMDWSAILGSINLTMSTGICAVRQEDSADDILARADAALYRAKDAGRNRVVSTKWNSGRSILWIAKKSRLNLAQSVVMASIFGIGDKIDQAFGNQAEGTVVAIFKNQAGKQRYAVEMFGHRIIQVESEGSLSDRRAALLRVHRFVGCSEKIAGRSAVVRKKRESDAGWYKYWMLHRSDWASDPWFEMGAHAARE
jgi:hypothetical protein